MFDVGVDILTPGYSQSAVLSALSQAAHWAETDW